ncbi:MAG TPA: serine hydrolase domain-containing protein, partial [Longimicrobiaceae bacterium]|nr:serine hydrolase domain-containing protein [Longimicrobiaceae bacterium]
IGSITKQFTAAAILKLEMEGKLSTADTLGRFFPDAPADKRGITIHQLLSHTSGLAEDPGGGEERDRERGIRKIFDTPLAAAPGTRNIYSNPGYVLLAAIAEKVGGMDLDELQRRELFAPAGMPRTGYRIPAAGGPAPAKLYVGDASNGSPMDDAYPNWARTGSGGVMSTAGQMYRWMRALKGDAVLSAAAKRKMWTPVLDDYGYGWGLRGSPWGRTIGHNGGNTQGTGTDLLWWPEQDVVVIVLGADDGMNVVLGRAGVSRQVQAIVFGDSAGAVPEVGRTDSASLARFTGTYALPTGGHVHAEAAARGLRLSGDAPDALAALAGEDTASQRFAGSMRQALALAQAIMAGDTAAVRAAAGADSDPARLIGLGSRLAGGMGDLRGVSPLGAVAVRGGEPPLAVVRVELARGAAYLGMAFGAEGLMTIRRLARPPSVIYVPLAAPGELGSMDWQTGAVRRIRFTTAPGGAREMRIATASGEITAAHQPGS